MAKSKIHGYQFYDQTILNVCKNQESRWQNYASCHADDFFKTKTLVQNSFKNQE